MRGYTLAVVAERAGISINHLSRIERGLRPPPRPSHTAYEAIAELYELNVRGLRRAAARERFTLVEGIPWKRSQLHR